MRRVTDISLPPTATLRQAMEILVDSAAQIILAVDGERRLLGTLTDGDIRRAILRQSGLDSPIGQVMNREPAVFHPGMSRDQARQAMESRGIRHLPVVDEDGRVLRLELLDDLLREPVLANWVVIMAGGQGLRLRPLTATTPKPLLSIGGQPLLQTTIENLAAQGFRRIFLAVNYKAEMIADHFGDGRAWGVEISYLREAAPLGTAGALALLPEAPTSPVLVMNGDILTLANFHRLIDFHDFHRAAATMCVRDYEHEIPYGVAQVDGARLVEIAEKPLQSFLVNAGLYLLAPEAVARIPKDARYDMPTLFQALIAEAAPTAVYRLREYWLDVGRISDLEQAQRDFAKMFG